MLNHCRFTVAVLLSLRCAEWAERRLSTRGGQKYSDRARSERTQRKAAEAELERLRVQWPLPHSLALPATECCAQLQVRQREAAAAVSELELLSSPVRGAIDQERTQLHAHLLQAESSLAEVTGPLQCVLELAL